MGLWRDFFFEDLDQVDFQVAITNWLSSVDLDWTLEAEYEGKIRPVGLVLGEYRIGGRGVEPHMFWFPWATPRIKFESVAHWLRYVRKEYKVFVYSEMDDTNFWDRMKKHRLLQRGCKIPDFYGPGDDTMLYYTQGPFA